LKHLPGLERLEDDLVAVGGGVHRLGFKAAEVEVGFLEEGLEMRKGAVGRAFRPIASGLNDAEASGDVPFVSVMTATIFGETLAIGEAEEELTDVFGGGPWGCHGQVVGGKIIVGDFAAGGEEMGTEITDGNEVSAIVFVSNGSKMDGGNGREQLKAEGSSVDIGADGPGIQFAIMGTFKDGTVGGGASSRDVSVIAREGREYKWRLTELGVLLCGEEEAKKSVVAAAASGVDRGRVDT
jgi:hypothetical protein